MSGPTAPTADVHAPAPSRSPSPASGPEGRTGVLLIHGFTGNPISMRPWGEHLAAEGFAVRGPLLPGHGTRWQDCNASTHEQWTTAVGRRRSTSSPPTATACSSPGCRWAARWRSGWPSCARRRRRAGAGQPLAAHPAAGRQAAAAAGPADPQLGADRQRHQEAGRHRAGLSQAADPGDDAAPRSCGRVTRADLAPVTAPVLVFRSVEDHVVEPASRRCCWPASPAPTPPRWCCEDSYHVATLDNDAPRIFAGSAEWIRAHVPAAAERPPSPTRPPEPA